jgi:hypothetical protein
MVALLPCANAQGLFQPVVEERPKTPEITKRDKVRFVFRMSEVSLAAATALDVATTDRGLSRPDMAYRTNNTFLMRYTVTEEGWTRCFGDQNMFAASAGNMFLNFGVDEVSRRMFRRGGRWRYAAIALEVAKTADNAFAGAHNLGLQRDIDKSVQQMTGYRGVIVWRSR